MKFEIVIIGNEQSNDPVNLLDVATNQEKLSMKALIIPFTLLFGLASACKAGDARKQISNYPPAIDSLHLNKLYDDTKWLLYLLHCDDTPMVEKNTIPIFKTPVTFGSLDLRFDSLQLTRDSVTLYFDYFYGDTLVSCVTFQEISNLSLIHGVRYSRTNDSFACYLYNCIDIASICNIMVKISNAPSGSRFVKSQTPDVVSYLNNNRSTIDPWLYKEAIKRGVISK